MGGGEPSGVCACGGAESKGGSGVLSCPIRVAIIVRLEKNMPKGALLGRLGVLFRRCARATSARHHTSAANSTRGEDWRSGRRARRTVPARGRNAAPTNLPLPQIGAIVADIRCIYMVCAPPRGRLAWRL